MVGINRSGGSGASSMRIRLVSSGSLVKPVAGDVLSLVLGNNIESAGANAVINRGAGFVALTSTFPYVLQAADIPPVGAARWPIVARAIELNLVSDPFYTVNPPGSATLRQVATDTQIMNIRAAANTTTYSRTPHTAKSDITNLAIVLPNWFVAGGTEQGAGATTWTAAVEYPQGTIKQILFSGIATGSVSSGANLVSDMVSVTIPKEAKFWIRLFQNAPSKAIYMNFYAGDGTAQFTSPSTDLTMGGDVTVCPARQSAITTPVAIIAMSSDPAVGIYGDSISVGRGDTATAGLPLQGHLGRAFGAVYACGHVGISGDTMSAFLASNTQRKALLQYFTHVAVNVGINDVTSGASAVTVAANTDAFVAALSPLPVALCTMIPVTSSTDNWATTVNQTLAPTNAIRVTENTRRKAGITGVKVIYDPNTALESVANPESGLWAVPGNTIDGTHMEQPACIAGAATVNVAALVS